MTVTLIVAVHLRGDFSSNMATVYTLSVPEKSIGPCAVYICIHFEHIADVYHTLQHSHSKVAMCPCLYRSRLQCSKLAIRYIGRNRVPMRLDVYVDILQSQTVYGEIHPHASDWARALCDFGIVIRLPRFSSSTTPLTLCIPNSTIIINGSSRYIYRASLSRGSIHVPQNGSHVDMPVPKAKTP